MEINVLIKKLREITRELEAHAMNPPGSCVGKLCWVSDLGTDEKIRAYRITRYNAAEYYPYHAEDNVWWRYATPVRPDELG